MPGATDGALLTLPNEDKLRVVLEPPDALVGRNWVDAGTHKPKGGVSVENAALAAALSQRGASPTFSTAELGELGADGLSPNSCIKVGVRYYRAVELDWACRLATNNDAESAILTLATCTLANTTTLHSCHGTPTAASCTQHRQEAGPGSVLLKLCVGGGKDNLFPSRMGEDGFYPAANRHQDVQFGAGLEIRNQTVRFETMLNCGNRAAGQPEGEECVIKSRCGVGGTRAHTHMHTHTFHTHRRAHTHAHTHVHSTHTHARTHTCAPARRAHTHAHTHTHSTHAHARTHTHTHTCMRQDRQASQRASRQGPARGDVLHVPAGRG